MQFLCVPLWEGHHVHPRRRSKLSPSNQSPSPSLYHQIRYQHTTPRDPICQSDRPSPASHLHCRANRWRLRRCVPPPSGEAKLGDLRLTLAASLEDSTQTSTVSVRNVVSTSWTIKCQIRKSTCGIGSFGATAAALSAHHAATDYPLPEALDKCHSSTGARLVLGVERGHGQGRPALKKGLLQSQANGLQRARVSAVMGAYLTQGRPSSDGSRATVSKKLR